MRKYSILLVGLIRQITYLVPEFFYKDSYFIQVKEIPQYMAWLFVFWYILKPKPPTRTDLIWLYVFISIEVLRLVNFISIFHVKIYANCLLIITLLIFVVGIVFLIKKATWKRKKNGMKVE